MSEQARPEASSLPADVAEVEWRTRDATPKDIPAIAEAIADLLLELGGSAPPHEQMRDAVQAVLEDEALGCVIVAEAGERLIGVLAASWQHAIHVPGPYCILQDLWTDPTWRSEGIGATLLCELFERMRGRGVTRVEVGLPSERFAALQATAAFYDVNGFTALGPRMRMVLP